MSTQNSSFQGRPFQVVFPMSQATTDLGIQLFLHAIQQNAEMHIKSNTLNFPTTTHRL